MICYPHLKGFFVTEKQETTTNWEWLKSYEPKLFNLDRVPLFSSMPPFCWATLQEKLTSHFKLDISEINPETPFFCDEKDLFDQLPSPHTFFAAQASGLKGKVTLALSSKDIDSLMQKMLGLEDELFEGIDEEYKKSFTTFLKAKLFSILKELNFAGLTFDPVEEETPSVPQLVQNIWIHIDGREVLAKVCISPEFLDAFQAYCTQTLHTHIDKDRLENIHLKLQVDAAETELDIQTLHSLKPGDFLIPDKIFFSPEEEAPQCRISIQGHPLFVGQIEGEKISLVNKAISHEAE